MIIDSSFWRDKKVLVTGHTGFKGGWLSVWLSQLNANVSGLALDPLEGPSFYEATSLGKVIQNDYRCDIRNRERLCEIVHEIRPDIVMHLAAQPIVKKSYLDPVDTYSTNVMGTVNLFEAIRTAESVKAVVNVTTDKCYENKEWIWPYRENEAMGGHDPYSSSKGCSELITSAYKRSFLSPMGIYLASARAGNVIGGGDWADYRLIPDFLRAIDSGEMLVIRSPNATRPWQHVLEPLSGYLCLAQNLFTFGEAYAEAWNFGPEESDTRSVQWIVEHMCKLDTSVQWRLDDLIEHHEATLLTLSSAKAKIGLGWRPCWNLAQALDATLKWHHEWKRGSDMIDASIQQIELYQESVQ